MKTQISNSLKDNMSSIQLKLNDFGLKDPIKKNTEELFKTKNTRPINQEYVYLNDNHFEYDNPTCSHCHKKHEKHKVIKKGFRTRKVRTTNKTKITIFLRRYQCKTCGKKFQTELSWLYDKNKRYTKQFFELIDKIMEFRNIPLPLLQHIINVVLNTNINLQTLEFWIKIKNKFSRNKEYLRSKTLSTLDKMTIANQTSQIFQIYRELSLYDTYKILNELKDIENQLLKPIKKKILNTTIENNINKIIIHLLYSEIPRTNNAVEQHYRNSLPKSKKNKKRTINGILTTLTTKMMKKFKNTKEK